MASDEQQEYDGERESHSEHRKHRQEVIFAVLMMVCASLFVQHVVPPQYFDIGLVATAPFHAIGIYIVIKSGIEPASTWLASEYCNGGRGHDWD